MACVLPYKDTTKSMCDSKFDASVSQEVGRHKIALCEDTGSSAARYWSTKQTRRVERKEQRAESREQRAESRAQSTEQTRRVEGTEQRAENREQRAESRERGQRTENREQRTEHRAQSTEHRAQNTENRAQSTKQTRRVEGTEHRADKEGGGHRAQSRRGDHRLSPDCRAIWRARWCLVYFRRIGRQRISLFFFHFVRSMFVRSMLPHPGLLTYAKGPYL